METRAIMNGWTTRAASLVLLAPLTTSGWAQEPEPARGLDDHPVHLDRTGIDWVLPFAAARDASQRSGHPILLKAVAFGTTKEGCW